MPDHLWVVARHGRLAHLANALAGGALPEVRAICGDKPERGWRQVMRAKPLKYPPACERCTRRLAGR